MIHGTAFRDTVYGTGQSEPAGTCGKQGNRSFSLSTPAKASLARACPGHRQYQEKRKPSLTTGSITEKRIHNRALSSYRIFK